MDMLIAIVPLPKPTVFFPKACLTVSGTSDAADLTALQGHPPPPQWSDGIAMVASTLFNHLLMVTVRLPLPQCHLLHPPSLQWSDAIFMVGIRTFSSTF
jgi:hypothetical protein